jgi:hypothetical protein
MKKIVSWSTPTLSDGERLSAMAELRRQRRRERRKEAKRVFAKPDRFVAQLPTICVDGRSITVNEDGRLRPQPECEGGVPPKREDIDECKTWLTTWADKTEKFILRNHPHRLANLCFRNRLTQPRGAVILAASELGFCMKLTNAGSFGDLGVRFKMDISRFNTKATQARAARRKSLQEAFRRIISSDPAVSALMPVLFPTPDKNPRGK